MRKQKGFTIIELIVVIAIIAVLAAVVAVNVMSYIAKAKNAAIQANMDLLPVSATAYYELADTYGNFCASADITKVYDAVKKINTVCGNDVMRCADSLNSFAISAQCTDDKWIVFSYLLDYSAYCVDSDGNKMIIPAGASSCTWLIPTGSCLCSDI